MSCSHLLDRLSLGKIVQIRERLLQAEAAGKKVYRFESGDPSFSLAPSVLQALQRAALDGKTHYIPNAGIPELRTALTSKLRTKNGFPSISAEHVFVTNGAMHALFAVFQCLLTPGDEVIVPEPEWTEAVENVRLALGVPVAVPLRAETGYQYDPGEIERRVSSRTRAIFLNSPHNPTGVVLGLDTLKAILEVARAHNLYIVSDEAYEDVIYEPNVHHSIASLAPDYQDRILSVFSFSKSHAMSGLRVGYLVTSDTHIMDRMQKVLRCSINGVNSVAQWTALAALQADPSHLIEMKRQYALRREVMFNALQGVAGIRPLLPQGAFYVWAEVDAEMPRRLGCTDVDGLSSYLAERGVGSAPGDAFGDSCQGAIRFAFSCATDMVEQGVPVLRQLLTAT